MTSLRFIGDIPWWLGLIFAIAVCAMSWRYYSRESFDLPRRLKWFLPLLRSLAFLLGIMVLTGPVLHHRTIKGELGRIKIYLDASNSMTMHDRHMSTGRKLLVAEQMGWLNAGRVDASLLRLADKLADARREFSDVLTNTAGLETAGLRSGGNQTADVADPARVSAAVEKFHSLLNSLQPALPAAVTGRFATELLDPVTAVVPAIDSSPETSVPQLMTLMTVCESIESAIRREFEQSIKEMVGSGDKSIGSAIAMFDETPRWQRAQLSLFDSSAGVLARLRQQHDVEVLVLSGDKATEQTDERLASASSTPDERQPAAEPEPFVGDFSGITDLSTGIVATQKGVAPATDSTDTPPQPQTAIVLLTDGQHNSGPSPLQTARVLGSQGLTFYNVSIGASQEASDLAVTGLEYPEMVFRKDRVRGVMMVRDRMPAGQPFVAQIRHEDEVLWQQQLITENIPERRIEFEFGIDKLIERLGARFGSDLKLNTLPLAFEASITPLADESETENNQQTMRLAAVIQSYRVLIVDGRSRWETRYLRNAFERDEQWHVNTILAGPGTDNAVLPRGDQDGQFPVDRDAIFEYDMVIVGEIQQELFTPQELGWLREFVELRGGGLMFIDGQRGLLRQWTNPGIASLLPVAWLPESLSSKPVSLQLTDKGANESALKLAGDDQQNRRFWTELPPPHNLVAVEALPGAEVIVEANVDSRQLPVMVTRLFGAGRVLYLASDETWRWRYKAADLWHQRIWNQLAKFVMPRPFAVSDEYVSLDTGPVRYEFGDSVDVRIRLLGLDEKPAAAATTEALLWKEGRIVSSVSLHPDSEIPGIYRGRSAALSEGEYEVSVRASGYSDSVLKARTRFVVLPPESGEMTQTAANETLLKQMSAASGGIYLREEEIGKLPELLSPLSSGRVVESETLIWQSWWWFAAIVLLLTTEWILRKRAGLL